MPDDPSLRYRILWLFPAAFAPFALLWCAGWFAFRYHFGEIMGSAAGILVLSAVLRSGLRRAGGLLESTAVVFLFYTIGYYLGEFGYRLLGGLSGKLLWGAGFGVGLGSGLAYLVRLPGRPRK